MGYPTLIGFQKGDYAAIPNDNKFFFIIDVKKLVGKIQIWI